MSKVALVVSCLAILQACGYTTETLDDSSNLDAVFTLRQPDREFDDLRTFAMPESIADLSDLVEDPERITDAYDQDYVDRMAENLADAGWTRVDDIDAADVLVLNGKVAAENWVTTYWYTYYPYYIYYPYYPYESYSVNFPVGSFVTVMLVPSELEVIEGLETVPAIWTATTLGLLSSDDAPKPRLERALDQAFAQSDYLVVGDAVDPVLGLDVPLPPP